MNNMIKYFRNIITLLICTIFFSSCLIYGRPESIFVNFVGRDLENFVEHKKTGIIPIEDINYTMVYIKRDFIMMGPPETRTRGDYLVSYLTLKKISDDSEEIIFTKKHGIDPGSINRVIVDKENHRLLFTVEENINGSRGEYLYIYDLINKQIINKMLILDRNKYKREDLFLSGAYISGMSYDYNNKLLFQVNFNLDTVYYEGRNYFSLNINTGEVYEISEDQYKEILTLLSIPESPYTYISNEITMKLFSIVPFSDYLPANFKHKYNGIYINDGTNNIRISRRTRHLERNVIWLENGKYVVNGSYLFDTSGRLNELKLADGEILTVF